MKVDSEETTCLLVAESEIACSSTLQSRKMASAAVAEIEKPDEKQHQHQSPSQQDQDQGQGQGPPHLQTHPLFPPLPTYGPPSLLLRIQYRAYRVTSFFLSLSFLGAVVAGAWCSGVWAGLKNFWARLRCRDPHAKRKFYEEEKQRKKARKEEVKRWKRRRREEQQQHHHGYARPEQVVDLEAGEGEEDELPSLEGGKDPVVCDVGYYARRVGLDVETFKVQTEDGFVITLWHVYNPREYTPRSPEERNYRDPLVFHDKKEGASFPTNNRRYPVLLIPGLLQSAGAYCCNDDDSLAFFLCKSGYDVWLGNNRCGFHPEHTTLSYSDPRMWAWNIRQMGVLDLPALVSRVLYETGFPKLALVCHSQGTTETLVALAKDQRPELGSRISVFCALAPAAYAGPLIKKAYFRFMRIISPTLFRLFFGIHAFIPCMMTMHAILPPRLYGSLGYRVFAFLFNWSDDRWDRGLRDRMFQFSPVYVSAESMRWWLGRECFAKQKCILATREQGQLEEDEDRNLNINLQCDDVDAKGNTTRSITAWFDGRVPPMALWIAGSDDLVDGKRLLRRLRNGREPHVRVVHAKVIDEYEHLDVIWAMDVIEQVGIEVREVIWRTVPAEVRGVCRVPRGVGVRVGVDLNGDGKRV
ncbi:hypothetical protein VTN00DRAFT_5295 [Thermoascus crustaceus]|uniref:uncharacterized protein n=1 Tax=Thermoascus crustaceus TaxID=5088 RepID=UPI003742BCDD